MINVRQKQPYMRNAAIFVRAMGVDHSLMKPDDLGYEEKEEGTWPCHRRREISYPARRMMMIMFAVADATTTADAGAAMNPAGDRQTLLPPIVPMPTSTTPQKRGKPV